MALDPSVRRVDDGHVLIGGYPLRILRLTSAGAWLVDQLDDGAPIPASPSAQRLVRRLLDAGIAHPRPTESTVGQSDVTVVIPVRDRPEELAATLEAIRASGAIGNTVATIVVDDGSVDPAVGSVATSAAAAVRRNECSLGPAAARNVGWRQATTELVAFVDAGCRPSPDWLAHLLPHFADSAVAGVAPRITTSIPATLPTMVARYEQARPTLDRGGQAATVRPRSPVPFVPTAALVVRRDVLEGVGGFDEAMRFGEDVDLVWRLVAAGWTVRYEPGATVVHPARRTAREWLGQRFDYGSSAAPLARRHGKAVAPLAVSPWSALAWALVATGRPVAGIAGIAVGVGTTGLLAPRLARLRHPWGEAVRLAGRGHLYAGLSIADALRRAWWPPAIALAVVSRRARIGLLAAATVPALLEWRRRRPLLDPLRWTALRLVDDVAYGAGVWAGCVREPSFAALQPDFVMWPGRRPAIEG